MDGGMVRLHCVHGMNNKCLMMCISCAGQAGNRLILRIGDCDVVPPTSQDRTAP
jgi:hypothetical protein